MKGLHRYFSLSVLTCLLISSLGLSATPVLAAPTGINRFVEPGGDPGNDCLTADTPCSLDEAMAEAGNGDTIYLFEGTYTHYSHLNLIELGPGKNVNLQGGWYGHTHLGNFTRLWIDPTLHPSTLDGQGERRGIYIHDGVTPVIDGLQIIHGAADVYQADLCGEFFMDAHACGGGIFIYNAAPTIQNCYFFDNRAMMIGSGTSMGYGGAIFVESPSGPVLIKDSDFDNNLATQVNTGHGGAIAIHGGPGSVTIINNEFVGNIATGAGGAIWATRYDGTLLWIYHNRFMYNQAHLGGSGITMSYIDQALISRNWFEGQQMEEPGLDVGTVQSNETGLYFNRNVLIDNENGYGLTISNSSGHEPQVINNLFVRSGHEATLGIIGWGGQTGYDTYTAYFKHNTLVGTATAESIAVESFSNGCDVSFCVEAIFENSILFKYGSGYSAPVGEKGKIVSDYTLFDLVTTPTDGYVMNYHQVDEPYAGFKDYLNDDYHLTYSAPARDKGKDAGVYLDYDGDKRPLGGGFDLGYDEFAYHFWIPLTMNH
jgi:hypothetical protein